MADRPTYSRALAFNVGTFAAVGLVSLASSIAVARAYGIHILGEFTLAAAPAAALTYLSTVREQAALVRELATLEPRAPRVTGLFAAVLAFSFGLTVVVAAIVLAVSWLVLRGPVGLPRLIGPAAALVGIYTLLQNTSWNCDMVFSAFRAGRQLLAIRVVESVAFPVIAVALSAVVHSVWGPVVATGGAAALALAVRVSPLRSLMRLRIARDDLENGFRALPAMLKWGAKAAPASVLEGINAQAPIWILGVVGSVAGVGAYGRAAMISRRFEDVNQKITEMLFPTLVERRARGDSEGSARAFGESMRYAAILLLLPAAVGGGAAHDVMALFGPGFTRAGPALAWLLWVPLLATIATIQASALWAANRPLFVSGIFAFTTVCKVAAAIGLAIAIGLTGVAIAVVGGLALRIVLVRVLAARNLPALGRYWPAREIARLAVAYGAGFAAAHLVESSTHHTVGLIAAVAAGSAAYLGSLLALGVFKPRDRARLAAGIRRGRSEAEAPA